ncbi:GAP family protein [Fulvivirga sedimenti]|uniref:GAP family protein n=1 Tax=Fulvivirga sedimenti TaxID=2879465 RepID=A0A9X1KWQ1_9BACT|nr:GAP family protein [Fulvivirga sedimenti]MCA6073472.1 GAP family protein [Fulvivirga sedimenti]
MSEALQASLPIAIALALSPAPIIAIFILLMTPKAAINGPSFLAGWFGGIYTVGVIMFILPGMEEDHSDPTRLSGYIRVALGLFLLIGALRYWLKRPKPGETVPTPKIFLHIDRFGFWKSFFTGILFSVVNVKNFALSAAGASTIDEVAQNDQGIYLDLAVFALIGSLMIILPIVVYTIAGKKIEGRFQYWKHWMIQNNHLLLIILLIVLGGVLIKGGLEILG